MDIWSILDHANKVWGAIAAVGGGAWLLRRLRRPDIVVEVTRSPGTIPPGLIEAFSRLVTAAKRALNKMPVPEEALALASREDLLAAANSEVADTMERYRSGYGSRIGALRLSIRNSSRNPIEGIRIFLDTKYGRAVDNLWSVDVEANFLTADAVRAFREGIHAAPNFVLPALPLIPSKSALQITVYGYIDSKCEVKIDGRDVKSRVEEIVEAKATRLLRALLLVQEDPKFVWFMVLVILIGVLNIWDDVRHR